ncbi:MAG: hypothetical protein AB7F49_29400, partial [Pseudorhodoplanes sp.]
MGIFPFLLLAFPFPRILFPFIFRHQNRQKRLCRSGFLHFYRRPRQFARFSHYFSHFRARQFGDWFDTHCAASQS